MPANSNTLTSIDIPWPYDRSQGKVRESFSLPGDRRIFVTTDRLSAFDRVLAAIPAKGQVLNQLSAFWFRKTADVIPNHLIRVPHPNISLVQACTPLPVEVIVRGYITGVTKTALWTLYQSGERHIYGYDLPDGLKKNDPLPEPLITPTTKAGPGEHDERLTCAEVVGKKLVDSNTWDAVQAAALEVFRRGQEIARAAGFILVDTKYEFGRAPDGSIMLIDEVHTPDSSRFWSVESLDKGEPDNWDKEFVRLWFVQQGYNGDGEPPTLPDSIVQETSRRYIELYKGLTGSSFEPAPPPLEENVINALESLLEEKDH